MTNIILIVVLSVVINVAITIVLLKIYTDIQWKFIADVENRIDKKLNIKALLRDNQIDK